MARAIDTIVRTIRQAIYGRDVREAIASGMEQTYDSCEGFKADAASSATAAAGSAAAAASSAAGVPAQVAALRETIAPDFDTAWNYDAGNYVYYNDQLYRFTADHSAGPWKGTDAEFIGVNEALAALDTAAAALAAGQPVVNLLPPVYSTENYYGDEYVSRGITWTLNKDGSVTAYGTATGDSLYYLTGTTLDVPVPPIELDPNKSYFVSGCPEGGSATTYNLRMRWTSYGETPVASGGNLKTDIGSGFASSSMDGYIPGYVSVYCRILSGYTCPDEGITFRPMLEIGDTAHGYVSNHLGIRALTQRMEDAEATDAAMQAALNSKAPIDSPEFTGIPTAPTPGGVGNSRIATTDFVAAQLAASEGSMENLIGATHISLGARRTLYVDGVNGDDTRTGASSAQALKTLAKAMEIVNLGQYASYNLYLAAGAEYELDASVVATPSLQLYPYSTYTKVTPAAGDSPVEMGWYERSAEDGSYDLSDNVEQTEFTDYYTKDAAPVLTITGATTPRIYSANFNIIGSSDCRITVTADYGVIGFYGGQGNLAFCDFTVPVKAVGGAYRFESCTFTVEAGKTYPSEVGTRAALFASTAILRVYGDTTFDVTDGMSYGLFIANSSTAKLQGTWHLKDQDSSIAQESRKPFLYTDFSTVFWYVANTPDTYSDPLFLGLVPYRNALEAVQSYISIGSKEGFNTLMQYGIVNTRSSIGYGEEWRNGDAGDIDDMVTVAESYFPHSRDLRYVNGGQYTATRNYNGGNTIDCSTFIGLVFMGLPYDDSPYNGVARHVGPYPWAVDMTRFRIDHGGELCRWLTFAGCRLSWEPEDVPETTRTAEEIIAKLQAAGVRKGDVIFTVNGPTEHPTSYLGLTHVTMLRTDNLNTAYPLIESNAAAQADGPAIWHKAITSLQCIKAICRPHTGAEAYGRYTEALEQMEELFYPDAQGRNILPWPYTDTDKTVNGITFTVNDDGSVHAVGTSTEAARFTLLDGTLPADKTYTFSGCPETGSSATYRQAALLKKPDGTDADGYPKGEFGDGVPLSTVDLGDENGQTAVLLEVVVSAGQTVDLTFHPMLEEGSRVSFFEPAPESNITLRKEIDELKAAVAALGGAV